MSATNIVIEASSKLGLRQNKFRLTADKKGLALIKAIRENSTVKDTTPIYAYHQGEIITEGTNIHKLEKEANGTVVVKVTDEEPEKEVVEKAEAEVDVAPKPAPEELQVEVSNINLIKRNSGGLSYYLFPTDYILEIQYTLKGKNCIIQEHYWDVTDSNHFLQRVSEIVKGSLPKNCVATFKFNAITL